MAGPWQTARVIAIRDEAPRVKTFRLDLGAPTGHRAGQHYVLRLTAPDGYTAQRSYSVAIRARRGPRARADRRAPGGRRGLRLPARRGRGGRRAGGPGPDRRLLRVGRTTPGAAGRRRLGPRAAHGDAAPGPGDRPRRPRPPRGLGPDARPTSTTPTSSPAPRSPSSTPGSRPPGSARPAGRLTADDLAPLVRPDATAYVCGSTGFADAASSLLVDLGVPGRADPGRALRRHRLNRRRRAAQLSDPPPIPLRPGPPRWRR